MASIKVFTTAGVKELECFDNYDDADFITGFEDEDLLPDFTPDEDDY